MCGNYVVNIAVNLRTEGSPPRVRELLRLVVLKHLYKGITPACAGITDFYLGRIQADWDHPRVCGNYI